MGKGKGNSWTMKHHQQKNSIQKTDRFAQHAMISVRWHGFVQTIGYQIVGLIDKSLNAIHRWERFFFSLLFLLLGLPKWKTRTFQTRDISIHFVIYLFFLMKYILDMILTIMMLCALPHLEFRISLIMLKRLFIHHFSHSIPFKNGLCIHRM